MHKHIKNNTTKSQITKSASSKHLNAVNETDSQSIKYSIVLPLRDNQTSIIVD